MKKKLISVLAVAIAIIMTLSMSACGGSGGSGGAKEKKDQTAFELYKTASEKMSDAEGLSMNLDMTVQSTESSDDDIAMSGPVQVIMKDDTNIEMMMTLSVSMMGMDVPISMYYVDGFAYMEAMGMKMKQAMDMDEAASTAQLGQVDFPEDAIKDQKITDTDDGKELSFTLDGAKMSSIMGDSLGSMEDLVGSIDGSYGDMTMVVYLDKDGKLTAMNLEAEFSASEEEGAEAQTGSFAMKVSEIEYENVTITPPADLDSFQETEF